MIYYIDVSVQVTRGMERVTQRKNVKTVAARNPRLAPRVLAFAVS